MKNITWSEEEKKTYKPKRSIILYEVNAEHG